ncbi:MAG: hypothetical protein ABJO36_01250 [Litorimonas sp.]
MRLILTTCLCLGFSTQAHAQWTLAGMEAGKQVNLPKEAKILTSGLIDSVNAVGISGFGLDLSEDQKTLTAKISSEVVSKFNSDKTRASSKSWDFSLSTPFEDTNVAELATLDRLSSGTKASAKFTWGRTSDIKFDGQEFDVNNFTSTDRETLDLARRNCLEENKSHPDKEKRCKIPKEGEGDELDVFRQRYAGVDYNLDAKHIWITASADLGYDDYEFLSETDLTAQKTQEFAYKAGVAFSYTETKSPFLFSVGANFESALDQADEVENCLGEDDAQNCVTGRLGAPERTDDWLAFSEVRRIVNINAGPVKQVGLAPRLTYNFSKGVTGVNMPVYFIKPEGGLSSGFQVGWRSDTDDLTAGIILGGTFDFISN